MDKPLRACVIGHPIVHSRSPLIHGHWLEQYGIKGAYEKLDVAPAILADFLSEIRLGSWLGCNVTIPHKQAVMTLVDSVADEARKIGAANTLWLEDGKLKATNTDAYGFAANMDDFAPDWREAQTCLIIGAGGAARAVVHACKEAGISDVTITNRTTERADELASEFSVHSVQLIEALQNLDLYQVIINTTSAGMGDIPPLPINFKSARSGTIAADIVYAPLNTQFLLDARTHGLRTVDGLGMLLHQAVPGFEKWFGQRPVVDTSLRRLILDDLGEP
ncbi:MAG: shikimate dehydrogenase [Pseudomonadota bacterium]